MYFRLNEFTVLTLFIMAVTLAMIWIRFRFRLDITWPLGYYAITIAYAEILEGKIHVVWLYVGLACGLLLRFEFMGKGVTKFIRVVELVVFAYVLVRCAQMVLNV